MSEKEIDDLIEAAGNALLKVPPNDDDHTVGAACLAKDGRLFTGAAYTQHQDWARTHFDQASTYTISQADLARSQSRSGRQPALGCSHRI